MTAPHNAVTTAVNAADTALARRCHRALEPLHANIYFSPEAEQAFGELGLEPATTRYFAGRAAPMGAVGAGAVAAAFYNFNPELVAKSLPHAWSIAAPAEVVAARFDAADRTLRRLLGPTVTSEEVGEAAALARRATEACTPEGRPLYAGHADLDWPEQPHLALWHAVTLLREYRGDGHLMALQTAGLSGLHALVLQITSGEGLSEQFAKASRGWSDGQWGDAQDVLRARKLLDSRNQLTDEARELRERIEQHTDALAMAPWRHLGETDSLRLAEIGKSLSKKVAAAGAFPGHAFGSRR